MSDDPKDDDESTGRDGVDEKTIVDERMIDDPIDGEPSGEEARRAWREGPDEGVRRESWLSLDDDDLLLRIETLGSEEDDDDHLLEVVASDRHFFIRQEAAKRVRDRKQLFAFEDDRHVGQILVRHLTRREDLTYLERLSIRCRHVEVRTAAQVQLARVWRWLECSNGASFSPVQPSPEVGETPAGGVLTTAALARDGVDASLLGWAAHFIVEHAWGHLGTTATRELLRRTHRELAEARGTLGLFRVTDEARAVATVPPGARVPAEAVVDLAVWMIAFRDAAREVAPEVRATSVRGCTALMADALREVGFYHACDQAEATRTA